MLEKIIVKKTHEYYDKPNITKGLLDTFYPHSTTSTNYKNWIANLDLKTCIECRKGMVKYIRLMKLLNKNHHYTIIADVKLYQ